MRKYHWLSLCVWLATLGVATAQWAQVNPMLTAGTRALHVSGTIDDDGDDLGMSLDLSAGQFVMDYIEAGLQLRLGFRGSDTKDFRLAMYGEYNFELGAQIVPYAGGTAGLGYWETRFDDETYLELTVYGGARYFFVDYAAIGADLALKAASADVYNGGQDSFDWVIRLRTTWYF